MKTKIVLLFLLIISLSCEDVVEVDLDTAEPKLVVEASIDWQKGTDGSLQTIKLSTTTAYFSNEIPKVSGALVEIKNSTNEVYVFTEQPNTGNYVCNYFEPILNETYTLSINYKGQIYTATEKLMPVSEILEIEQINDGGFTGESIELKFYFQDNGLENNFYMSKLNLPSKININPEYAAFDDKFLQGNLIFDYYTDEDLATGDSIAYTLYGISQQYYNYMNILLNIAGNNSGGPFSTAPATVRGNILNQSNPENYPLGYFRLSETDTETYVVE